MNIIREKLQDVNSFQPWQELIEKEVNSEESTLSAKVRVVVADFNDRLKSQSLLTTIAKSIISPQENEFSIRFTEVETLHQALSAAFHDLISSQDGIAVALDLKKQNILELYWKLLVKECNLFIDLADYGKRNNAAFTPDAADCLITSLMKMASFVKDPLLDNAQLFSSATHNFSQSTATFKDLLLSYTRSIQQELSLRNCQIALQQPEVSDADTTSAKLEEAQIQQHLSKLKLFITSQRLQMLETLFKREIERIQGKERPIVEQELTLDETEQSNLKAIQDLYLETITSLTEESDLRKRQKRLYLQENGQRRLEPYENSNSYTLIKTSTEQEAFNELIQQTEVVLLSPVGAYLLEPEKHQNAAKAAVQDFTGTSFRKIVHAIKSKIRDLKTQKASLPKFPIPHDGTDIGIIQAKSKEREIVRQKEDFDSQINMQKLSLARIKLGRLIEIIRNTKSSIKAIQKEIQRDTQRIAKYKDHSELCQKLIDNLQERENQEIPQELRQNILDSTSIELQTWLSKKTKNAGITKEARIQALNDLKATTQAKMQQRQLGIILKKNEIARAEQKANILEDAYSNWIAEYESLYFKQPSQSAQDLILEEAKGYIKKICTLGQADHGIHHPRDIQADHHYASLGYVMQDEVMKFCESIKLRLQEKRTPPVDWQTIVLEEMQKFSLWADKHPSSATNIAGDMMQVVSILADQNFAQRFASTLKAKLYANAVLNTGGFYETEPLDEEGELHYRAIADLIHYAPIFASTIKAISGGSGSSSLTRTILSTIQNALTGAVKDKVIQKCLNQLTAARAETVLRSYRLLVNAMMSSPYIDSVVEQRNFQFLSFISQMKDALVKPGSFAKRIRHNFKHWCRSIKHSEGAEFWFRGAVQIAIPVLGMGAMTSTAFMLTPAGAYAASYVFGSAIGFGSFFGITGFVAFSIYLSAIQFSQYLNGVYDNTQKKVWRDEALDYYAENQENFKNKVEEDIRQFRNKGILPILNSYEEHPLKDNPGYSEAKKVMIQKFTESLHKQLTLKKSATEFVSAKDCLNVFCEAGNDNTTLVEMFRQEAKVALAPLAETHQLSTANVVLSVNQLVYEVVRTLEEGWLKNELLNASKEEFIRSYISSFNPNHNRMGARGELTHEARIKERLKNYVKERLPPESSDGSIPSHEEWLEILNNATDSIERAWNRVYQRVTNTTNAV